MTAIACLTAFGVATLLYAPDQVGNNQFTALAIATIDHARAGAIALDDLVDVPFTEQAEVANLRTDFPEGHHWILRAEAFFPGILINAFALAETTGLETEVAFHVPFATILIPLLIVATATLSRQSKLVIGLPLLLYATVRVLNVGFASTYAATYGITLALLVLLVAQPILVHGRHLSHQRIVLLAVSISALAITWHSALILVLILMPIVIIMQSIRMAGRVDWLTLFVTFVPAVTFFQLWKQQEFIQGLVSSDPFSHVFSETVRQALGRGGTSIPYAYNYRAEPLGAALFYSEYLVYFTILLIWLWQIFSSFRKDPSDWRRGALLLALPIAQLAWTASYARSASISLAYVPLFFPLAIAASSSSHPQKRKHLALMIGALALLALGPLGFAIAGENGNSYATHMRTEVQPDVIWLEQHASSSFRTDFDSYGLVAQIDARTPKSHLDVSALEILDYRRAVEGRHLGSDILLPIHAMAEGQPISVVELRGRLQPKDAEIQANQNLNAIYATERFVFFVSIQISDS